MINTNNIRKTIEDDLLEVPFQIQNKINKSFDLVLFFKLRKFGGLHLELKKIDAYERKCFLKLKKTNNNQKIELILKEILTIYEITVKTLRDYVYKIEKKQIKWNFDENFSKKISDFIRDTQFDTDSEIFIEYIVTFSIKYKIKTILNEINLLVKFPMLYYYRNILHTNYYNRYEDETIVYKNIFIRTIAPHRFGIFFGEMVNEDTSVEELINVLSYLSCKPILYKIENWNYYDKLNSLYENFDFIDLLKLRKKNYLLNTKKEDSLYMEETLLKYKGNFDKVIKIDEVSDKEIFSLYASSLKQFEPLPRCVFLYRVFEHGANIHYKPKFTPSKYEPSDAINYYFSKIKEHKYIPKYYQVKDNFYYKSIDADNGKERKKKIFNIMSNVVLK